MRGSLDKSLSSSERKILKDNNGRVQYRQCREGQCAGWKEQDDGYLVGGGKGRCEVEVDGIRKGKMMGEIYGGRSLEAKGIGSKIGLGPLEDQGLMGRGQRERGWSLPLKRVVIIHRIQADGRAIANDDNNNHGAEPALTVKRRLVR